MWPATSTSRPSNSGSSSGRDPEGVAEAAAKYGWTESATDWRSVIARDDIHVVDICAPGFMHAEIAIAALAAGKHVLVEKPLANTLPEAEAMAFAAARRPVPRRAVHGRFQLPPGPRPGPRQELISEGRLGTVRHVRAAYLQDWLANPKQRPMSWRLQKDTAGSGALGRHRQPRDRSGAVPARGPGYPRSPAGCTPSPHTARGPAGLEEVTVDDAAWAIARRLRPGPSLRLKSPGSPLGQKNSLKLEIYGDIGSLSLRPGEPQ